MDILFERAKYGLDRLAERLFFLWRTQRSQLQVLGGALLVLVAILAWDSSQWTQPPRSDLLSDLTYSQDGPPTADSVSWTSVQRAASHLSGRQQHQLQQLSQQTEALQFLASHSNWTTGMGNASVWEDLLRPADWQAVISDLENAVTKAQASIDQIWENARQSCDPLSLHEQTHTSFCDSIAQTQAMLSPGPTHLAPPALDAEEQHDSIEVMSAEHFMQEHPRKALFIWTGLTLCPRLTTVVLWYYQPGLVSHMVNATLQNAILHRWPIKQLFQSQLPAKLAFFLSPSTMNAMYVSMTVEGWKRFAIWLVCMYMGMCTLAADCYCLNAITSDNIRWQHKLRCFSTWQAQAVAHCLVFSSILVAFSWVLPSFLYKALIFCWVIMLPMANLIVVRPLWNAIEAEHGARVQHRENAPAAQPAARNVNDENPPWRAAVAHAQGALRQGHDGAAAPADPAATPGHRHRDRHQHKDPFWPTPLVVPEHLEDVPGIPDSFKCPITFSIMKEPATTRQGITYDKSAILRWIEQHRRDPTTGTKLKAHHLSPNLSLRNVIQSWIDTHQKSVFPL